MATRDTISATIEEWRSEAAPSYETQSTNNLLYRSQSSHGASAPVGRTNLAYCLANRDSALTFALKARLVDEPKQSTAIAALAWKAVLSLQTSLTMTAQAPPQVQPPDPCLSSPRLKPDHILTELLDVQLANRIKRLSLNARTLG